MYLSAVYPNKFGQHTFLLRLLSCQFHRNQAVFMSMVSLINQGLSGSLKQSWSLSAQSIFWPQTSLYITRQSSVKDSLQISSQHKDCILPRTCSSVYMALKKTLTSLKPELKNPVNWEVTRGCTNSFQLWVSERLSEKSRWKIQNRICHIPIL